MYVYISCWSGEVQHRPVCGSSMSLECIQHGQDTSFVCSSIPYTYVRMYMRKGCAGVKPWKCWVPCMRVSPWYRSNFQPVIWLVATALASMVQSIDCCTGLPSKQTVLIQLALAIHTYLRQLCRWELHQRESREWVSQWVYCLIFCCYGNRTN